jgi:hypothetical protein
MIGTAPAATRLSAVRRFYFHCVRDGDVLADDEGVEAPDLDTARRLATKAAADIAADELARGAERVSERILILSHTGQELASLAIDATLKFEVGHLPPSATNSRNRTR